MKTRFLFAGLLAGSLLFADGLYESSYMEQSGITSPRIDTGLPNQVNGSTLLHWNSYVVRSTPLIFRGTQLDRDSEETLAQIEDLIRENRSRIRYISLIGHSSQVVGREDRIELSGWSSLWQHMGGDHRLDEKEAAELVNHRLKEVYDAVSKAGMPASRIYTENLLDHQPLYTEATSEGRLGNNRVEVTFFSTGPLSLGDLHIQFALDSSRILPSYDERVVRFADLLKRNPTLHAIIVGHTDRRGSYAYNIALSKRRAEAVKARLVELGISPERLQTEGRGYTEPIASGHTESAYRENRRIEARLYR